MLIDDVTITIKAGNGGNGLISFNKTKMSLGPTGGNGGTGGNVIFEAVSNLGALLQFQHKRDLSAKNGENGKIQLNDGANAQDLVFKIPVGTTIHNLTTGQTIELTTLKQRYLAAKGGKGGRGNFLFRSSINTTPKQAESGQKGEKFTIRLELKLIADIGFIGLPNVGKSSLLNELTNAKSKIGNYPFTTLEPNLGVYYELILADIPGLIEGASIGKGLGIKFLRHIERTKILFHFISLESPDPLKDYRVIRKELEIYNKTLLNKEEYIILTKSDAISPQEISEKIKLFENLGKKCLAISIIDEQSLKNLEALLRTIIKTKYEDNNDKALKIKEKRKV